MNMSIALFFTAVLPLLGQEKQFSGFPDVGSIIPVGKFKYKIVEYLGSGPKKRAFFADKVADDADIPQDQLYICPIEMGTVASHVEFPDSVVLKASATNERKRVDKLEYEYKHLIYLNEIRSVKKPLVLYLSNQWKCIEGSDFTCQYLVMTKASFDIHKSVTRRLLNLRAPLIPGHVSDSEGFGVHSFELFLATFTLSFIGEVEKLHAVGIIHGDLSPVNVALDPTDNTLVHIIDLGSSRFMDKYVFALSRLEWHIKHDFDRVKSVALRLLNSAVHMHYPDEVLPSGNPLYSLISGSQTKGELRVKLLSYLKNEFPKIVFDGRIIYRE